MSLSTSGQTSTPSSDFKSILDAGLNRALSEYKNKTGKPLLDHQLASELQRCDSADSIKAVLQTQAEAFQQFRDGDKRLMKWINPVVDVLSTFSDTIGEAAGIVRPLKCRSCNIEAHPNLMCRGLPLRKPSLPRSEFFSLSVTSQSLFVDPSYHPNIGSKRRESESRCARRTHRAHEGLLSASWSLYPNSVDCRNGTSPCENRCRDIIYPVHRYEGDKTKASK